MPRRSTATSAWRRRATSPCSIPHSGETAELELVIDHFQAVGIPIVAITGNPASTLGEAASAPLVLPHWREVGPEAVAPTTSTTMTLALGDALAMTVMREKGFASTYFGRLHPGGSLGARLKPVSRLMHGGAAMPLIDAAPASIHDTIMEMTAKLLGLVGVTDDDGRLIGIITDGDLRRNIERGLDHQAGEFMTASPKTIAPDTPGRRGAGPVRRISDHRPVRGRGGEAGRRAPHPRLSGVPDERRHPDPGAVRVVALSGQAAWSN